MASSLEMKDIFACLHQFEMRLARLEDQFSQPASRPVKFVQNATIDALIDSLYAEAITSLPETVNQLTKLSSELSSVVVSPNVANFPQRNVQPQGDSIKENQRVKNTIFDYLPFKKSKSKSQVIEPKNGITIGNKAESESLRRLTRNLKESQPNNSVSSLMDKNNKCKVKQNVSGKDRKGKSPSKGSHKSAKNDKKGVLEIGSPNNTSSFVDASVPKATKDRTDNKVKYSTSVMSLRRGETGKVTTPKLMRHQSMVKVSTPKSSGPPAITDLPTPEVLPFVARRNMWERRSIGPGCKFSAK